MRRRRRGVPSKCPLERVGYLGVGKMERLLHIYQTVLSVGKQTFWTLYLCSSLYFCAFVFLCILPHKRSVSQKYFYCESDEKLLIWWRWECFHSLSEEGSRPFKSPFRRCLSAVEVPVGLKTFCTDPPLQPTAGRVSQTNRLDNRFLQHAHQAEREIVFVFVHSCIFIFVHSKCVHHCSSQWSW